MEAPSTPPLKTSRLRVPPTPTYGTLLDHWEPHSPRRSSRTSSNPYSTPKVAARDAPRGATNMNYLIPTTSLFSSASKSTLAFTLNDVFSPPSSPMSNAAGSRNADNSTVNNPNLDDEAPSSVTKSSALFPTPAKTPSMTPARKHQRTASMRSAARVLPFQPEHPNDVMPTRRENRKINGPRAGDLGYGLEDYADDQDNSDPGFQIYTEFNARVPEKDESPANPFYCPRPAKKKNKKKSSTDDLKQGQRKNSADIPAEEAIEHADKAEEGRPEKSAEIRAEESNIDHAARNDKGLVYSL